MGKGNKSEKENLSKNAEEILNMESSKITSEHSEETLKLTYELRESQSELKLKNKELILALSNAEDASKLFDFTPAGNFTISNEGEIIKLNICGSQMLGRNRSLLKTSRFGFFVSDDTKPIFNLFIKKVFNNTVKESCEVTLSIDDNLPMYVHLLGIASRNGEQCFVSMTDITERKQLEMELVYQNEEKAKRVTELVIANKEKDKRVAELVIANEEKAKRVAELRIANIEKAKRVKELVIADEEKAKRVAELVIADEEKAKQAAELVIANKEKEKRASELIIANKELAYQNKEKEKRAAELINANKELEAFSYSVSHDLRAPLRHINGYVDLLLSRFYDSLPDKARHYLDNIADSSRQMGTLIDDLLQFSRIGRQEKRLVNFDMNIIVNEVLVPLKQDNHKRNIEWRIATLPHVYADQALLRLVWTNLLNNAVKFTQTREKTIIEINALDENDEFIFSIHDNGVGFDMQYAHKLFGVFQRLHPTDEFEGTGIGLANVQHIILRHGGRTWAEAETDKGATFYFSLPKNKEN